MEQNQIDEKVVNNSFKKNIGLVGIAFILFIFNIKILGISASQLVGGILLIVAGKYFIENYQKKKVTIGGILFLIGVGVAFIASIVSPLLLAKVVDKINDIVNKIPHILDIAEQGNETNNYTEEIYKEIKSFIEYFINLKSRIVISCILTNCAQIILYFGIFFAARGVKEVSNSEEAQEKIAKVSVVVLIFGILASIVNIILASVSLDASGQVLNAINNDSASIVTMLPSIVPTIIVSFISFVIGIVYFINLIILTVQIFKTQEADKDNDSVLNNK